MDIEAAALGRFGVALRTAFGARLHGVHDLDRDATERLVAVVLVGAIAEGTRRLRIVEAVLRSAIASDLADAAMGWAWAVPGGAVMPDARFTVDGSGRAMSPLWHFVHGCRAEDIRPDEILQAYLGHWSMPASLPPVVEATIEGERWARVRVGVAVIQAIAAVQAHLHDEMLFRFWEWTTGQARTPEAPGEGNPR